jgi:hypothetical protein
MRSKLVAAFLGALFALEVPGSSSERLQQLTLVSTINIPGAVGVSAFKDLVFVGQPPNAFGGGSVAIFDIKEPANPVRLSETPRFRGVGLEESHAIEIGGRDALAVSLTGAASSRGLKLFDISDVSQPVQLGSYGPGPGLLGGAIHFDVAETEDERVLAFLSAAGSEAATSNLGVAATARVHDLTLITSDTAIRKSGAVPTLW